MIGVLLPLATKMKWTQYKLKGFQSKPTSLSVTVLDQVCGLCYFRVDNHHRERMG